MLAELSPGLPRGPGWAFEIKWDGMRACVSALPGGQLKIFSRRGIDYTDCFPELHPLRAQLPAGTILDGEIVVLDTKGRSDFDRLQERWHRPLPAIAAKLARINPVTFVAFDLLWCAGRTLHHEAYTYRRDQLRDLQFRGQRWLSPDDHRLDGAALFAACQANGLEGIVAKRLSSPYRPGQRSKDWLKIKNYRTDRFIVGGWIPTSTGSVEALLVGQRDVKGDLCFSGTVEFGLNGKRRELLPALGLIASPTCPFARFDGRVAHWVQPRIEASVRFIGLNRGVLREATLSSVAVI